MESRRISPASVTSLILALVIAALVYVLLANRGRIFEPGISPDVANVFFLPAGDPAGGRRAFVELGCSACHRVQGETFDEPMVDPPVPVVLGHHQARQPRWRLAESIIAPSHRMNRRLDNVQVEGQSRMQDYNDILTVRQLVDLVAFLQRLDQAAGKGD